MLCLRCSRVLGTVPARSITSRATRNATKPVSAQRTLTSLAPRRPTIFPTSLRLPLETAPSAPSTGASVTAPLDLMPKISAHPALASTQVRCGPRDTYSPSHFVRKRRHGFLSRIRTRKGRAMLQRKKAKGRKRLSH